MAKKTTPRDPSGSPTPAVVLERLEQGGLQDLARITVEHLLSRPIHELVDPEWAARQMVLALESVSSGPETEKWLRRGMNDLREQVPEGTVRRRVPSEIVLPLRDVVGKPYLPDRRLVGRLLEHDAVRRLLQDVLVGALEGFVTKIRVGATSTPTGAKLSRLKALGERALHDGVLGGLSQEIERQAELKIREFVDGAVHAVVSQVADHVCAREHVDRYAAFRVHLVDTLLDTDLEVLAGEIDKLHPDDLVATGAATARALAHRAGFVEEVASVLRAAMDASAGRSLQDVLVEAGIADSWRSEVESQLVERSRELVATEPFRLWLTDLLAPA